MRFSDIWKCHFGQRLTSVFLCCLLFSRLRKPRCCITTIFCTFLQYDAFDIGFITTDDFTNADILEATYPAVAKRLHGDWISDPAIPIVTGFLGKVTPLMILSISNYSNGFLLPLS